MFSNASKYWIIVASRVHVQNGLKEGVCQANHGKEAPLRRMKQGDWVVFYSLRERFEGEEKCKRFTAIGRIKDDNVYQMTMTDDFRPFRRRDEFYPCGEAPIESLIAGLSFIKNKKSWSYVFKFGLLQIPRDDFQLIAKQMLPLLQQESL